MDILNPINVWQSCQAGFQADGDDDKEQNVWGFTEKAASQYVHDLDSRLGLLRGFVF